MKKLSKAIILLLVLSLFATFMPVNAYASDIGTVYYIDSENGSDSNDGLSADSPWKTLDRASDVSSADFLQEETVLQKTPLPFQLTVTVTYLY